MNTCRQTRQIGSRYGVSTAFDAVGGIYGRSVEVIPGRVEVVLERVEVVPGGVKVVPRRMKVVPRRE